VNGFLLLLSYYLQTLTTILLPHTRFSKLQNNAPLKVQTLYNFSENYEYSTGSRQTMKYNLFDVFFFYLQTLTTILLSHTRFSKLQQ